MILILRLGFTISVCLNRTYSYSVHLNFNHIRYSCCLIFPLISCLLHTFQDGGCFRLFPETSDVPLDIEPRADRLLLLWSDRRNPHEVRPVYRDR